MVAGPGIVTGRYGTIGEVFTSEVAFWPLNTTLYVRDFKDHALFWYVYHLLLGLDFPANTLIKQPVPGVNRNALHSERVLLPPLDIVRAFDGTVEPLTALARLNTAQNETLAAIRDLLLPKLMSGEIRVRDAERVVEAVA